jgi:hypothetical protein
MKPFCFLSVVVLTCQAIPGGEQSAGAMQPPVLRKYEPADNVVVTLPGPAAAATAAAAEAAPPGPPATAVRLASPPPDPDRPVLRRSKPEFPPGFERDSADFLDQQIGIWQQVDAEGLLGKPLRQRSAFADDETVNGQILAFADPTGRYQEMELDFDSHTGLLRTLFVYPRTMTWQDCRHTFGANVRPTQANKGRTFYSYVDRRLDVLVDAAGKVISLGMY